MNFDEIINKINVDLNNPSEKIKLDLIYAFNGTGKTRISRFLSENNSDRCLCFNSLFQDEFIWNNDDFILNIRKNSWIVKMIYDQGLQNQIVDNFQRIYNDSIEPVFNEDCSEIYFNAKTEEGYDISIKISKAEETVFILSIFYTFLDVAILELQEDIENRSTDIFDNLEIIIIDDPVSSVDDRIILKLAILISKIIEKCISDNNRRILSKFLITTHHSLFYNSIYNLVNRNKNIKNNAYILLKENNYYKLEKRTDITFGYHLYLINNIKKDIDNQIIKKEHFNMFRIILEKTANYFGYNKYESCLPESKYKSELIRLVNLYSHGNFPDFEYSKLTENDKEVLKNSFADYLKKYDIEVCNE